MAPGLSWGQRSLTQILLRGCEMLTDVEVTEARASPSLQLPEGPTRVAILWKA